LLDRWDTTILSRSSFPPPPAASLFFDLIHLLTFPHDVFPVHCCCPLPLQCTSSIRWYFPVFEPCKLLFPFCGRRGAFRSPFCCQASPSSRKPLVKVVSQVSTFFWNPFTVSLLNWAPSSVFSPNSFLRFFRTEGSLSPESLQERPQLHSLV